MLGWAGLVSLDCWLLIVGWSAYGFTVCSERYVCSEYPLSVLELGSLSLSSSLFDILISARHILVLGGRERGGFLGCGLL